MPRWRKVDDKHMKKKTKIIYVEQRNLHTTVFITLKYVMNNTKR